MIKILHNTHVLGTLILNLFLGATFKKLFQISINRILKLTKTVFFFTVLELTKGDVESNFEIYNNLVIKTVFFY